jgi:hypothetical protein
MMKQPDSATYVLALELIRALFGNLMVGFGHRMKNLGVRGGTI